MANIYTTMERKAKSIENKKFKDYEQWGIPDYYTEPEVLSHHCYDYYMEGINGTVYTIINWIKRHPNFTKEELLDYLKD